MSKIMDLIGCTFWLKINKNIFKFIINKNFTKNKFKHLITETLLSTGYLKWCKNNTHLY